MPENSGVDMGIKVADCCLLGNPKSKVLMNIAASFPSVKKPRYVDQEKSRQYD
jgi:hypothetical protein